RRERLGSRAAAAGAPRRRGRPDRREVRGSLRAHHRRALLTVPFADGRHDGARLAPMRFAFEVLVTLKPGLADPQGRAVQASLPALGWTNVSAVRVGKHISLEVDAPDGEAARAQVGDMAARLLANPVIEDARVVEIETR